MQSNLFVVAAGFNLLSAMAMLWIMQCVTRDAGYISVRGRLNLLHRLSLAIISVLLFANSAYILTSESAPRGLDLAVEAGLSLVVLCSAIRHAVARRAAARGEHHPSGATPDWRS